MEILQLGWTRTTNVPFGSRRFHINILDQLNVISVIDWKKIIKYPAYCRLGTIGLRLFNRYIDVCIIISDRAAATNKLYSSHTNEFNRISCTVLVAVQIMLVIDERVTWGHRSLTDFVRPGSSGSRDAAGTIAHLCFSFLLSQFPFLFVPGVSLSSTAVVNCPDKRTISPQTSLPRLRPFCLETVRRKIC